MKVVAPVFIIGTGRCGSSIFHEVFSHHRQMTWRSSLCKARPDRPEWNRLALSFIDRPPLGGMLRHWIFPEESYAFWDHLCPGFTQPSHDLGAEDLPPRSGARVREIFERMISPRRPRVLDKITGWPRIGLLRSIFPDARFIHICRDGRAVANSMLNVEWWSGWLGPGNWRWGELTNAQREKWERHDRSFVALAAIEWEILMAASDAAKAALPAEDLLEIKYADLCADPIGNYRRAVEFCEVDWSAGFERAVGGFRLRDTNHKWRDDLSPAQQRVLNDCLADVLPKHGFTL